ncbi:hypothetical protein [Myceligenerans indicum]|uniref:Uncharacterized protein n=1 Tax=Myceligenerans indicum TaxID=2593663 RepID=A0ABS1LIR2_9MICO|nr:hypothetical protein [Myceligenerans indicum]MBL0886081.1 hypothetical protein [Myceligenerans indicum]
MSAALLLAIAAGGLALVELAEAEGGSPVPAAAALGIPADDLPAPVSGSDTVLVAFGAESGSPLRAGGGEALAVLTVLIAPGVVRFRGRTRDRPIPRSLASFEVPVSPA